MARSQETSAAQQRRKTGHVDGKDRFLNDGPANASRNTRSHAPVSYPPNRRHVSAAAPQQERRIPRYSDSVVPLKEDTSSRAHHEAEESASRLRALPKSTSRRQLKPAISLSNMFEEGAADQDGPTLPTSDLGPARSRTEPFPQRKGVGHDRPPVSEGSRPGRARQLQARLRSLSDASLYCRPTGADCDYAPFGAEDYDRHLAVHRRADNLVRDDSADSVEYVDDKEEEVTARKALDGDETFVQAEKLNAPPSSDNSDAANATIGLTEFAKLQKPISAEPNEDQEKTLVESAEPIISELAHLYGKEWDTAVLEEEKLYKQTAMSLGALLDNEVLASARCLKQRVDRCSAYHDTFIDSNAKETKALQKSMTKLVASQKELLLKLKEVEARMTSRDEKIVETIRDIHERYVLKQKTIEDDYVSKADKLDDDIKAIKKQRSDPKNFTAFFVKLTSEQMAATAKPAAPRNKGTKK